MLLVQPPVQGTEPAGCVLQNSHGSRKSSRSRVNSFNAGERQEIGDSVRFNKPNGGIENAFGRRKVNPAAPVQLSTAVCAIQHGMASAPLEATPWSAICSIHQDCWTCVPRQSGAIWPTWLHVQDPENVFAAFRTTARPSASAPQDALDADPLSEPESVPMQRQSSRLPSALSDRRYDQPFHAHSLLHARTQLQQLTMICCS